MKSNVIGITGMVLVLLGLIATACIYAFLPGIDKLDWLDAEAAAGGSMVICLLGCVLGWIAFKTSAGRVAAIVGTLLIAFYVFQLLRSSEGAPEPEPLRPIEQVDDSGQKTRSLPPRESDPQAQP